MKKINRLLAFLLAFTVVITTFSSDLTTAHVYATEAETVIDSEDEIKTVEKEEIPVVSEASTEESTEASTEGSTEEAATAADTEENAGEGDKNDDAATTGIDGEVVNPEAVGEEETDADDDDKESLSQEVDGILITLEADEGVLPEDAKLIVSKVSASVEEDIKELLDEETGDDVKVQDTFSFDINIYSESEGDPDNNYYVQPNGDVNVTFESIEAAEAEDVALSVYHVTDDIENATSVSDVVTGDETDITITTDHFSIYAVTLTVYGRNYSYTDSFDLEQVDVDLNRINGNSRIPITFNKGTITVDELKNRISSYTPNGYSLLGIYAKGGLGKKYVVSSFTYDGYSIEYTAQDGKTHEADWAQGIYAIYRKNDQTTTSHHIDLGFTESDFNKYLNKASVSVKIGSDGQFQPMDVDTSVYHDNYDGGDYYEYRYNSSQPISVNSPITFKVVFNGDSYTMRCDSAKNIAAFERCFKAHWTQQSEFGFDYVSDFEKDFVVNSKITYHSNDGRNKVKEDSISAEGQTVKREVLTYDATSMGKKNSDYEFLGWSTSSTAETPDSTLDAESLTGPNRTKIDVSDKQDIHYYAVWKKYQVKFVDYDKQTKVYSDQKVVAGEKATVVTAPTKTDYDFDGWFVEKNNELVSFNFNTIIKKETIVYAKWSAKTVKVAVYASDGTSSTTANKQLERLLGLKYVQDDGYYPVGVVELPASLFTGKTSPYIKTDDDWTAVYNSLGTIDKTALQNKGLDNKDNSVQSNLQFVQKNLDCGRGNHETALFDWNEGEHGDARYHYQTSIKKPTSGEYYKYHLDLRFTTNTVKYDGVYFVNGVNPSKVQSIETVDFLTGQSVTSEDHPSMDSHKTKDGNEYTFDGFYQNEECTIPFESKVVSDNKTVIYAKFNRVENYSVEYKLTGDVPTGVTAPNKDENITYNTLYTVKTATDVEGYDFDGWYYNAVEGQAAEKKISFNVTENVVLTGSYTKQTGISYKVQYWLQNAEDNDYKPFGNPVSKSGAFGAQAVYDKNDGMFGDGFHYAVTKVNNVPITDDTTIKVPAKDKAELIINVYYDRAVFEVTYAYVGSDIPEIVDPTKAQIDVIKEKYRFGQEVKLRADAVAPGYTFNGWKAYPNNNNSNEIDQQTAEVAPESEGVVAAVKLFFATITRKITGEDGKETTTTSFKMPASNVRVEGSFTKSPYNIVIELKGNAEGGSFDYELPYNADKQTAPVEFELEVYLNDDLISASAATSENLDVLMASLDKAMSLGALTVYAAEGEELPIAEPIAVNEVKTYKGEAQEVVKTVEKKVTVDGREYTVTVNLAGGYGTDARDYDIYIDSLTFKLGDKDVSDLFTTNMVEKQVVGKLTITPAMITIKADDKSKTEGQADPTFTSKLSGLVGKDAEHQEEVDNFILPQVKYDRESGEAPGRYKITPRAPRQDDYEQVIIVNPGDENNLRSLEEASQQLEELSREDAIQAGVEEYLEQGVVKELQDREEYQLPPVYRILRNYDYQFVDGYLTINGRGGDDEEYVPRDPDADSPVAAAPAPAVLGAQRELPGEAPAVLGARRAGTSDTNILGSIITIIVAAAIAFSMVFIKRKKKEEN